MKSAAIILATVATADKNDVLEPLLSLETLRGFATEWTTTNLNENRADNFSERYKRNAKRLKFKFERCRSNPDVSNRELVGKTFYSKIFLPMR